MPTGAKASNELAKSSAVYRDQLRQIDAELKAGSINEAEAQATRAETARRLVLAEREEKSQAEPAQFGDRTFSAVGIAVAVALGSAILYAKIGEPDRIPKVHPPMVWHLVTPATRGHCLPRHPAVARAQPSGAADAQGGGQAPALPTVDGMIDRLVQRLRANPEDAEGWRMLGWSYASQGRFKEATAAYQDAIKRQPENADLYSARGEILVRAGNGVVSPEAASMFDEALKRDKADPRARFFLGLRKEQAGDGKAALDDWISILQRCAGGRTLGAAISGNVSNNSPPSSKSILAGRLPVVPSASPGPQIGGGGPGILGALKGEGRPGPQSPAAAGTGVSASKGLSADDDQSAMIRGMVDGLAARLEKQPRDFEGWSRLIRSRAVLGEKEKAKTALAKAREIFADTPEALAAIGATAREIRLEP